ncbi:MAG TPA: hypothetical protein VNM87_14270, partial [Candidatus Udaeobacter sp.]|nr:hypothetical protein [Candidatus Udaeobacter sp.]
MTRPRAALFHRVSSFAAGLVLACVGALAALPACAGELPGASGSGEIAVTLDPARFAPPAGDAAELGDPPSHRVTLLLPPATEIVGVEIDPGYHATSGESGSMRGISLGTVDWAPAGKDGAELAARSLPVTLRVRYAPLAPAAAAGIR